MLIICSEEEKRKIMHQCNGECGDCVFKHVECPIEKSMILTSNQIERGKELKVRE